MHIEPLRGAIRPRVCTGFGLWLTSQPGHQVREIVVAKDLAETMVTPQYGIILLQCNRTRLLHLVMPKLHELRSGPVWLVLIEWRNEWGTRCGVIPHHER